MADIVRMDGFRGGHVVFDAGEGLRYKDYDKKEANYIFNYWLV